MRGAAPAALGGCWAAPRSRADPAAQAPRFVQPGSSAAVERTLHSQLGHQVGAEHPFVHLLRGGTRERREAGGGGAGAGCCSAAPTWQKPSKCTGHLQETCTHTPAPHLQARDVCVEAQQLRQHQRAAVVGVEEPARHSTAWAQHGHSMGTAWAQHSMGHARRATQRSRPPLYGRRHPGLEARGSVARSPQRGSGQASGRRSLVGAGRKDDALGLVCARVLICQDVVRDNSQVGGGGGLPRERVPRRRRRGRGRHLHRPALGGQRRAQRHCLLRRPAAAAVLAWGCRAAAGGALHPQAQPRILCCGPIPAAGGPRQRLEIAAARGALAVPLPPARVLVGEMQLQAAAAKEGEGEVGLY